MLGVENQRNVDGAAVQLVGLLAKEQMEKVAGGVVVIGFGDKIGLPDKLSVAGDILLVGFDTALVNAPTVAIDANILAKNCITAVGDGTKVLRAIYQV